MTNGEWFEFEKVLNKIYHKDIRNRSLTKKQKIHFEYSVKFILTDLWKKFNQHQELECAINKRSGYYSELTRYKDPNLTYRMNMKAFDGLQDLGLINITKKGYYDRNIMQGSLTKFRATNKLQEMFKEINGHPSILLKPNIDIETILLRDNVNGKRTLVDYEDNKDTERWRNNLKKINSCFSKHIIDLRIKDEEVIKLQDRLLREDDKEPFDLTKKVLVRIFTNNSFENGGRFYRGWWQNIPSEYRKFITLDSKVTTEFDYSQLNPNMIYDRHNLELGSDDAYDRVLEGKHRDTVKQAFNAMIQSSTPLTQKPEKLNLSNLDMSWKDLRDSILRAHKPIEYLFFKGIGNRLQFEDSCIAESIMLHFANMDAPALPVHDSFIMHHSFGSYGELEEVMRRAYYERFNTDIKVKKEMVVEQKSNIPINEDGSISLEVDDILSAENEYSGWRDRDRMWLSKKR